MIPAVVLAAGESSRMGRPKALLPTGVPGETFLTRLVATLRTAGADDVLVVVAAEAAPIVAAATAMALPPRLVENRDSARGGQLSSLVAGLNAIDRPGVRAMLVTPVDLPLVAVETVRAILDASRRTGAPIVRPAKGSRHGHPVVFDRSVFDELRRADPATGAKAVVRAHAAEVVDVAVDDEGAFLDIDTPEDYERLIGKPPRE